MTVTRSEREGDDPDRTDGSAMLAAARTKVSRARNDSTFSSYLPRQYFDDQAHSPRADSKGFTPKVLPMSSAAE
jgi:hypothetical protein